VKIGVVTINSNYP